jgi:RNA polymerase sigma-70 factor, ECF subfamily
VGLSAVELGDDRSDPRARRARGLRRPLGRALRLRGALARRRRAGRRGGAGDLPEIGSLRTWLFAILRNVVIDLGRARASRPRVAESGIEPAVEPLEQALLAWQVEEAMRRIGEDHRKVLLETHFRARPYAEVAEELGVPEGTIKSRVYYGLKALRVAMEEMGYED